MQPRSNSAAGFRWVVLVAMVLLAGGCSSNSGRITGPGDVGGKHLVVYATDRGGTAGQFHLVLYDIDAQMNSRHAGCGDGLR